MEGWEGGRWEGYGNWQVRFDLRSDCLPVFAVGWLGMFCFVFLHTFLILIHTVPVQGSRLEQGTRPFSPRREAVGERASKPVALLSKAMFLRVSQQGCSAFLGNLLSNFQLSWMRLENKKGPQFTFQHVQGLQF